jgi:orotate phosphoribosyltransferase-like protein
MNTNVAYIDTALPLAATTVVLFSTVQSFPAAKYLQMLNVHRVTISLKASNDGTVKTYKSQDRGVNWTQIGSQAITGSSTAQSVVDVLVQEYADFKAEFLVGASNETVFSVDISLTSQRALGA